MVATRDMSRTTYCMPIATGRRRSECPPPPPPRDDDDDDDGGDGDDDDDDVVVAVSFVGLAPAVLRAVETFRTTCFFFVYLKGKIRFFLFIF